MVAVFVGDQFSVRADKVTALSQIDANQFVTQIPVSRPNTVPQLAYRFSKRPYEVDLKVTRRVTQAHVAAMQAVLIAGHKQHLTTRLHYNVTGSARSTLKVSLPQKFLVLDVASPDLRDWSVATVDGNSQLTVELESPRLGQIELVLGGTVTRDATVDSLSLVFPQPVDANRLDTNVAIWLEEGLNATLDDFPGWRSLDVSLASPELKQLQPNRPMQFAFNSSNILPSPIGLKLSQSSPKLTTHGLSMLTVTDVGVVHTLALQWFITGASTDALYFTTPSQLAGKLQFTGNGIREATSVDAGNGRVRWTVSLRTPVTGKFFATAVGTFPPANREVEAAPIVFEQKVSLNGAAEASGTAAANVGNGQSQFAPVNGQQQFVLLINSSSSQLSSSNSDAAEPVQNVDVPIVLDPALMNQATELLRVKSPGITPKWSMQKFVQTASVAASVNVADLTTVVSRDGTYRSRAIYTIKNRSRQFLPIKIPAKSDILSVTVANQPSRAVTASRNGAVMHLIPLPKTSAASLSFRVMVILRGQLPGSLPKSATWTRSDFEFAAPEIVSQQSDSEFGITVARTRWALHLPDDLDAMPVSDSARFNLTWQRDESADLLYQMAAVQEFSDLLSVAEQSGNGRTRAEA
ncbi:MAG: hypothetical protein FJ267_07385, partial [Planctomycetes bacterium]|nr:hypothetical protein [Planctomycetota bacterium]